MATATTYVPVASAKGAPLGKLTILPSEYPTTHRDGSIVDKYHNINIPDPYRWLENPDSEETKSFVDAQNKITSKVLDQCPSRDSFRNLFTAMYNYERYGIPFREGQRYYYSYNSGLLQHNIIYTMPSLQGPAEVFIDPNTLSVDGTVALMSYSFSECGCYVACTFSDGGSDWRSIKIYQIDQETGKPTELTDVLHNVKFTSIAWTHDSKGFFYNTYDAPDTTDAGTETEKNINQKLRYHLLGEPQDRDAFVLALPDHPEWMISADVTLDGRYLILSISEGCNPSNLLWYVDLKKIPTTEQLGGSTVLDFTDYDFFTGSNALPIIKLINTFEASWEYVGDSSWSGSRYFMQASVIDDQNVNTQNDPPPASTEITGSDMPSQVPTSTTSTITTRKNTTDDNEDNIPMTWTLLTNYQAPRYKLVRLDVHKQQGCPPDPQSWHEIIPQHSKDVLQWVSVLAKDTCIACYLRDVKSQLQLRKYSDGDVLQELETDIGSVSVFSGSHKHTEFFFSFTGFTQPGAHYRCDVSSMPTSDGNGGSAGIEAELFRQINVKFDPSKYITKQVFVPSKDKTPVPMFIVHRKGILYDGKNPTLLYGYGGFNVSLEPAFSITRMAWLLAYDGVFAVANLRGGGEYGREWRDAGSLGNKQNVFDDFQACASYLHEFGYCDASTLAIQGGSNGGLLVGACVNQRPDLYACGLAQVGVMDMLRFSLFTIGHAWVNDYGDVNKKEEFEWLIKYSPLHNVAIPSHGEGQYPAILLTTGSHDDRVVPLHTHKLVAQMQYTLCGCGDDDDDVDTRRERDDAFVQRNPICARVEVRAGHGAGKPTKKIIEEQTDMMVFAATVMGADFKYQEENGEEA